MKTKPVYPTLSKPSTTFQSCCYKTLILFVNTVVFTVSTSFYQRSLQPTYDVYRDILPKEILLYSKINSTVSMCEQDCNFRQTSRNIIIQSFHGLSYLYVLEDRCLIQRKRTVLKRAFMCVQDCYFHYTTRNIINQNLLGLGHLYVLEDGFLIKRKRTVFKVVCIHYHVCYLCFAYIVFTFLFIIHLILHQL